MQYCSRFALIAGGTPCGPSNCDQNIFAEPSFAALPSFRLPLFVRQLTRLVIITPSTTQVPTAMVVAHPGHEVRVHGWVELTRPQLFILTDGSGHSGESRLAATSNLLAEMDVKAGSIYGQFSERTFYDSVLNQNLSLFIKLAEELAEAFRREGIERVVGDAAEGYNSTHDVCRLVVNAAVAMVNCGRSTRITNYDFPVVGSPDSCPEEMRSEALWIHLDDQAFTRKIDAAQKYYPELLDEVRKAYNGNGNGTGGPLREYLHDHELSLPHETNGGALDLFRVECMRPVNDAEPYHQKFSTPPFYERHGERQRDAGIYQRVIRYRDHLVPIAEALQNHVQGGC